LFSLWPIFEGFLRAALGLAELSEVLLAGLSVTGALISG